MSGDLADSSGSSGDSGLTVSSGLTTGTVGISDGIITCGAAIPVGRTEIYCVDNRSWEERKWVTIQVKKLSDNATTPTRATRGAAGYDLSSAASITVKAGGRAVVPTDISIALPRGVYGRIAPRSGLAVKHGINVGAGVIDEDYRGPVGVVLFNHSDTDFKISQGDRIAQLIPEVYMHYSEVLEVSELSDTQRGGGGFGSTGK